MSETSIEAVGLGKVYWDGSRKLEILKDVSLSVRTGEAVAIWGPSGSGKTTLLNLLSGLDRPDGGTIRIQGIDLNRLAEKDLAEFRNRTIGFVFQFYHLLSEFTALENVMLPALIGSKAGPGRQLTARAEVLLERMGLRDRARHFPSELSGGEQQRVAIARAMMNDPDILFCDEPTGNLDQRMGQEIVTILRRLFREEKKTLVIVTHDEKMAHICDRIWKLVDKVWESKTNQ